ncbi:MAG: metallophosphoesterase [Vicinamibacterales bacterium]
MRLAPFALAGSIAAVALATMPGAGPVAATAPAAPLVTAPYLQLGDTFDRASLAVVWHQATGTAPATVEWRRDDGHGGPAGTAGAGGVAPADAAAGNAAAAAPVARDAAWRPVPLPARLDLPDRVVYTATLDVGRDGGAFRYRLRDQGTTIVEATGLAPSRPGAPIRFAVIGDTGDGGPDQRAVASRLLAEHARQPLAFTLLTGDLVYDCGLRAEYDRSFFPVFNGDDPDGGTTGRSGGVPLMRTVPFVGAAGNHDVGDKGFWIFDRCAPDYAYLDFWRHPPGFMGAVPIARDRAPERPASGARVVAADLPAALARANFSFTWGDVHVTVLDSNRDVDWAAPALRAWLDRDLAAARGSRWRVVALHHPPFHFSDTHREQQWTRALAPVFERHGVALVLAGHVHNFQWFGPARFTPDPSALDAFAAGVRGRLPGRATLAPSPDGTPVRVADGPVYVVTGAGGHDLKDQRMRCPADLRPEPPACLEGPAVNGREPSVTVIEPARSAYSVRSPPPDVSCSREFRAGGIVEDSRRPARRRGRATSRPPPRDPPRYVRP